MVCILLMKFNLYFYSEGRKNGLWVRLRSKEDVDFKYRFSGMKGIEMKKIMFWDSYIISSVFRGLLYFNIIMINVNF